LLFDCWFTHRVIKKKTISTFGKTTFPDGEAMEPISYEIDTEVPVSYLEKLLDFIHKKYLLTQKDRFRGIARKKAETGDILSYSVVDEKGRTTLPV
jgi:hypothetical protein